MPLLYARQNPLDSVRTTLSSWDNCMAKSYCKWPVIVAIIVGSLIVLSVVICIGRCICCGAECAICCCKCCTCCCGGSGRSGHKRMKSEPTPTYPPYAAAGAPNPYAQNPYAQAHAAAPPAPFQQQPLNQQYRSHATPAFASAPAHTNDPPQFATFASPSKPTNEDALPAMPSWGDARDRHVEVEEEALPPRRGDMEMDRLNHNGSVNSGTMATGMAAVGTRRSPGPAMSPVSPIGGYGYNQGFEKEPLVGGAPHRSPHASPAPYGRPYAQQDDYRRGSPAQNMAPAYGGAGEGYAQTQPYDHHSPAPQQQPYDQYNHRDQYDHEDNYSQAQTLPPYRSPSPPAQPTYNYNTNNASYDDYAAAPVPAPARTHTPGYSQPPQAPAPAAYNHAELSAEPVSAYPGQRSYTPQAAYPGQASYQAFNPGQTGPQFSGVQRKGVPGSEREL